MPSPGRHLTTVARFEVQLVPEDLARLSALYPNHEPADAVIAAIRALALGPDIHAAIGGLGQQQRSIIDMLDQLAKLVDLVGGRVIEAGAKAGHQRNAELLQGLADLLAGDDEEEPRPDEAR